MDVHVRRAGCRLRYPMEHVLDGRLDEWLAAEREKLAAWKRLATPTGIAVSAAADDPAAPPRNNFV